MTLQNRVCPDGSLHANTARGFFTGNRGIIHDPVKKQLVGRRWTTPAWICCSLEWKGKRREVWGRNGPNRSAGWSELFFLDEVTALAAGHRPCHLCRRQAAIQFHFAYCSANGEMDAAAKNALLHRERWQSSKQKPEPLTGDALRSLPDGVMIKSGFGFLAIRNKKLLRWDFGGYGEPHEIASLHKQPIQLVTPASVIGAFAMGYQPVWHSSAS